MRPPRAAEAKPVELVPKGQNGVTVNTVESTASIEAIDYQAGAIALKGAERSKSWIRF